MTREQMFQKIRALYERHFDRLWDKAKAGTSSQGVLPPGLYSGLIKKHSGEMTHEKYVSIQEDVDWLLLTRYPEERKVIFSMEFGNSSMQYDVVLHSSGVFEAKDHLNNNASVGDKEIEKGLEVLRNACIVYQ